MDKKEIRYVKGSAKKIETQYGSMINVSINVEDFNSLPANQGYVKLTLSDRKEADQYGNNMTIKLNDYVGEKKSPSNYDKSEELPF